MGDGYCLERRGWVAADEGCSSLLSISERERERSWSSHMNSEEEEEGGDDDDGVWFVNVEK